MAASRGHAISLGVHLAFPAAALAAKELKRVPVSRDGEDEG
jgi:hypothetical protein